ncbi:MAG: UDP-N-acetylmuramoyl-L-alanine--D-glutamate ligase [Thermoleophilia bacterium]
MTGALDLPRLPIVLGAGRSGLAAATALAEAGREVTLVDDDPARVSGAPVPVVGPDEVEYAGCEAIIRSPGVANGHPVLQAAHELGIPIWSEVELGYRLLPPGARVIGITGTNGKTTTTELVGAMLREAGLPHQVCGNVGIALCDVAPHVPEGAIVVCELSSFQLEDIISFHCDAAALTNVTPDHLDRHGSMEEYARIKLRIFETQDDQDTAVLNVDDPFCDEQRRVPGDGAVVRVRGADAEEAGFAESRLRGDHNRENVAVAAALARAVGVSDAAIASAVRQFHPVAHRLEDCGEANGVRFWNDSKATNVDATLKALTAFPDEPVRLILGGSDKGADFVPLATALAGQIQRAYLTGPAGRRMADPLAARGVDAVLCDDFDDAVRRATLDSAPGDHVLLAPACASFDEFTDYVARGEHFRELAGELGAR